MPPVVTGRNRDDYWSQPCPVTIKGVAGQPFEMWMALITVLSMGIIAVFYQRLITAFITVGGFIDCLCHLCGCDEYSRIW